jgi:hypothetical protein
MFRIYAPKASEVRVSGDWIAQGRGTGGKLEKDDQGVWSITVGPLVRISIAILSTSMA